MTNPHPITPPSELIEMVSLEAQAAFPDDEGGGVETDEAREEYIAIFFSQWGSDQELRACVEKVRLMEGDSIAEELFEARRPGQAPPPDTFTTRIMNRLPVDRPWRDYPIGTKAHSCTGGSWTRVEHGWKWCSGDTFPTPGGDACGNCIELPATP
jgi:hypothetical protein